jgi:Tol biopolymer transport system component
MDGDGSNLQDLTVGAYDYLQMGDWSPGGGRFAFTHINAGPGIDNVWTINSDGTNPQQVTSGYRAYQPQWRPEP